MHLFDSHSANGETVAGDHAVAVFQAILSQALR